MTAQRLVNTWAETVIAEVLCPPSHRDGWVRGIVGRPIESGPRRVCTLHSVMAKNVSSALVDAGLLRPEMHAARECRPETCGGVDYDPCWLLARCPACGIDQEARADRRCRTRDCTGRLEESAHAEQAATEERASHE